LTCKRAAKKIQISTKKIQRYTFRSFGSSVYIYLSWSWLSDYLFIGPRDWWVCCLGHPIFHLLFSIYRRFLFFLFVVHGCIGALWKIRRYDPIGSAWSIDLRPTRRERIDLLRNYNSPTPARPINNGR